MPVASFVGRAPDLERVRSVLLVRLRSIGDTVLVTPCVTALKRWRPGLRVDVLLEPLSAPVLEGHPEVDRVVVVERSSAGRLAAVSGLRKAGYDLAIDLNGGTTAALLALATGARWRVGFSGYRTARLANCRVTSSSHVWGRAEVHTVEHQLALVAGIGIPVESAPPTSLAATPQATARLEERLQSCGLARGRYAVLHPEASLETKKWPAERFGQLASWVYDRYGLPSAVIGIDFERLAQVARSHPSIVPLPGLPLSETLALIERSVLFVGNDSGPAHVAAAFTIPTVVLFGPSNTRLWRPWSPGPWKVLHKEPLRELDLEPVEEAVAEVLAGVAV